MAKRLEWDKIVAETCARMREGQSVRKIAKALNVDRGTLLERLAEEKYADQYARARTIRADVLAEEVLAVADDPDLSHEHKRIMVDARKWYASKLAPKSYGEKQAVEHGGGVTVRLEYVEADD